MCDGLLLTGVVFTGTLVKTRRLAVKRFRGSVGLIVGIILLIASGAACAQSKTSVARPDWQLNPTYGTVELGAGFQPDPNLTMVRAGGNADLESIGFYGYVAEAPDLDLQYEAGGYSLYIYVSDAQADTVLLINDPMGEWFFNDDADGLDLRSGIVIHDPESGLYDIWVGTFDTGMVQAEIAISEMSWGSAPSGEGEMPDWELEPTFGTVDLAAGFKRDPYEIELIAGGSADLNSVGFSGYVATAPDVDLQYEAGGYSLYIYVTGTGDDTVLLINDPMGDWLFNDDADGLGLRSGIEIRNPDSGLYDIWVGTYGYDLISATLVISEAGW